jgi:hypothetical protein
MRMLCHEEMHACAAAGFQFKQLLSIGQRPVAQLAALHRLQEPDIGSHDLCLAQAFLNPARQP